MSEYRQKLQGLLRELFQFDSADLDFGIYAVMNHKRDQVERFIGRDLLDAIEEGLKLETEAVRSAARTAFEDARAGLLEAAGGDALDAQGNVTQTVKAGTFPVIRQPVERYEQARAALDAVRLSEEMEAQVYNDLYRFFSRYYDDGDFISQRRYGAADKYAIPYNGEEVTLYWANADQYYVKSGEYFTDYRFTLDGALGFEPATIAFKLRAASVEQNNVKGEKRFFLLAAGDAVQWDGNGRTLTVAFEYRPLAEDEKKRLGVQKPQEKLTAEAGPAILAATPDPLVRERLSRLEGDNGKTVLARHLARYAAKNTRDYFIHKDLRGFLTRELDYFLKSEVLNLDDVDWARPDRVGLTAARLQTIRQIAGKIIAFLAQIEDFQKRLWEKRKFVVQSDYCVTLDRVPEALYGEIAANTRQRAEWARLYAVELGPDADLREHPYMMIDTAFFDVVFKACLLASFDDLDAACDGLLVHGENYGALRLLLPRYREQVKCIYIDPPYNTSDESFMYKNDYKHSSWVAMIANRVGLGKELLPEDGVLNVAIDDTEAHNLRYVLDLVFGSQNYISTIAAEVNPAGQNLRPNVPARSHDYCQIYAKEIEKARILERPLTEEEQKLYSERDEKGHFLWDNLRRRGGNSRPADRPKQWFPLYVALEERRVSVEPFPGAKEVWPIDPKGEQRIWRVNPDGARREIAAGTISVTTKAGRSEVIMKSRMPAGKKPKTLWKDPRHSATTYGTKLLGDFADIQGFTYPKSLWLVQDCVRHWAAEDDMVMDFFAGSGTTAHAVMRLNREDSGLRRYILVEVGAYFDTVLKLRIQRAAYCDEWKDQRPVAGSPGQSHMFHYIRLESYEDTLNNLRFRDLEAPLLGKLDEMPDYFLRYMLDFETQGSPSLLDARQFERPFDYRLEITRDGVNAPQPVDLVTTFNFLLGLRVRTIRRFERDGAPVVRVAGEDGGGRRVCVLWRDVPPPEEMEAEKAWLQAHVLGDVQYDLLYVNGESAQPGALPIEPEFHRLMFEGLS